MDGGKEKFGRLLHEQMHAVLAEKLARGFVHSSRGQDKPFLSDKKNGLTVVVENTSAARCQKHDKDSCKESSSSYDQTEARMRFYQVVMALAIRHGDAPPCCIINMLGERIPFDASEVSTSRSPSPLYLAKSSAVTVVGASGMNGVKPEVSVNSTDDSILQTVSSSDVVTCVSGVAGVIVDRSKVIKSDLTSEKQDVPEVVSAKSVMVTKVNATTFGDDTGLDAVTASTDNDLHDTMTTDGSGHKHGCCVVM